MPFLAAIRLGLLLFLMLPWGAYAHRPVQAQLGDQVSAVQAETVATESRASAKVYALAKKCRTALAGSSCNPLPVLALAEPTADAQPPRSAPHPDVIAPAGTLRRSRIYHPPRSA